MNDLDLIKVKAFYYAKVIEFGGDFEKANKLIQCIGVLDDKYQNLRHKRELRLDPGLGYRIKPETVIHPGGEMPKPLSVEEADEADCIYVARFDSQGVLSLCVRNYTTKHNYGFIGHAYSTEDEARSAAHIMFNIPKGE